TRRLNHDPASRLRCGAGNQMMRRVTGVSSMNRRTLLAGLAVAPATAAAAIPAPDRKLFDLAKEFEDARAGFEAIDAIQDKMEEDHADWQDALDDVNEVVGDIVTTRARTIEGLRIKARAIWWDRRDEWTNDDHGELDGGHEWFLACFLRDLVPDDP